MMNRKNNILKIFIVIVCLFAVTVFALYESGANLPFIEAYKHNFKKNVAGISNMIGLELPIEMQLYLDDMSTPPPKATMTPSEGQSEFFNSFGYHTEENVETKEGTTPLTTKKPIKKNGGADVLPIALSSAENAKFALYKGNILCVNETEFSIYSQKGECIYRETIQMQSPELTVMGDYILINEIGDRKISLYKGKKNLFTVKTEGNIISADLSENGDVVAVTEKEFYKGQIVVYNKSGKLVFAWDSGSYNIIDADISKNRRVAVAMLNTDSGADTFVTCFNLSGKIKYKTENFADTLIFDIEFAGKNLNAAADNKCFSLSASGKVNWSYDYSDKKLFRYAENDGYTLLVFDTQSTGEMVAVTPKGKVYAPIKTESMPESIAITKKRSVYNSGRDIVMTDLKGKKVLRASCDSNIKQLHILDSNHALAVYSSSIQVKKLEKPAKAEALPETN